MAGADGQGEGRRNDECVVHFARYQQKPQIEYVEQHERTRKSHGQSGEVVALGQGFQAQKRGQAAGHSEGQRESGSERVGLVADLAQQHAAKQHKGRAQGRGQAEGFRNDIPAGMHDAHRQRRAQGEARQYGNVGGQH